MADVISGASFSRRFPASICFANIIALEIVETIISLSMTENNVSLQKLFLYRPFTPKEYLIFFT